MIRGVRFADIDGEALLASIFRGLVEWVWVASLPVSWLGLCRLGVAVCRVSPRGGRAVPGARGVFLQDRGGQEMSSACLRGGECLEAPEPGKQEVGPGVVGLVAQDGAAGVVGDDSGDAHQPQSDRSGLPGAGGGVGQGEQLGEGQQACGPEPRSGTRPGWPQTPARGSGQVRCPWHSGCGPLAASPQSVAHLEIGELTHPRAGGEGGQSVAAHVLEAQLGALVG